LTPHLLLPLLLALTQQSLARHSPALLLLLLPLQPGCYQCLAPQLCLAQPLLTLMLVMLGCCLHTQCQAFLAS
jgi:hypothetical protein